MKHFILKIIFVLTICLLFIRLTSSFFPFYGNNLMQTKFEHLESQQEQYNTLYFGSSHAYRHIDPKIVDSITSGKTTSFNMGGVGTFPLENLYILEKALKHKKTKPKYVVIQIQTPRPLDDKNVTAAQSYYFLNFKSLRRAISYKKVNKLFKLPNFYKCYLLNLIRYRNSIPIVQKEVRLNKKIISNNGFLALDEQQFLLNDNYLAKRHREVFSNEFNNTIKKNLKLREPSIGEKWTLDEVNRIAIKYSGVKFLLFFNPLRNVNCWHLDDENLADNCQILSFDNTDLISDLNYYFDRGHLNAKGAKQFSTKIGNYFIDNVME